MKEFSMAEYEGQPIVIYGASGLGEYTLSALRRHGIEPICFCDKYKNGEIIRGIDVRDYTYVLSLKNAMVLLAVGTSLKAVRNFLLENSVTNIFSIYRFVFEEKNWDIDQISTEFHDEDYFKLSYRYALEKLQDEEGLTTLEWVITEKCSLKCRDCANLMQYYEAPCNYSVVELQKNLDRVLSIFGKIFSLRIIGGEPFMNPEMPEIIEKYLEDDRILNITILTNATILPKEKTLQILRHPKISVYISHYGEIAKNFNEFVALMEKEKIQYVIKRHESWKDLGKLENRKKTQEEMIDTFSSCGNKACLTLLRDKIYRCEFSANGRNLEAIPDIEEDRVHLCGSDSYIREKLRWLLEEKKFDHACGYCSGRGGKSVKPAIQSDRPLPYSKIK